MTGPDPTVTLFTETPLQLEMEVSGPDERAPLTYVLITLSNGRPVARCSVSLEWSAEITTLIREPRHLMYLGWQEEPGIQAHLFVLVPDQSESWKGAEGLEAYYIGTVVRASECRVHPDDLAAEAADHFAAILSGKTVEPIEQLMKRLA